MAGWELYSLPSLRDREVRRRTDFRRRPATPAPALGGPTQPTIQDLYGNFLRQIERPLLDYLNRDDRSGYDFANLVIEYHGRRAYDEVQEFGKEALTAILSAYQPIGDVIRRIPARFAEFPDDFFARGEIHEEVEREEEEESAGQRLSKNR